jgi:hypothetical protein
VSAGCGNDYCIQQQEASLQQQQQATKRLEVLPANVKAENVVAFFIVLN